MVLTDRGTFQQQAEKWVEGGGLDLYKNLYEYSKAATEVDIKIERIDLFSIRSDAVLFIQL